MGVRTRTGVGHPRPWAAALLTSALLVGLIGPFGSPAGAAGEPIVAGQIRTDSTFEHIGLLWWVSGDVDHDSSMSIEYRLQGQPGWRPGAPAMRAYPEIRVQDDPLGLDYWAASAMWLQPGGTYELRATLTDPDGGGTTRTVTASTRTMPAPAAGGRTLHVSPGSGGGAGSPADPFRGLQAAADIAQPGDTFVVSAGTYAPFEMLASGAPGAPVSFVGPEEGTAVIDGQGVDAGVVTLGRYDQTLSHVILEGFSIRNGRWGVDAQHTRDIAIVGNRITDVDDGIVNRRDSANERNQTVCDNVITGREPWPGSGIPSSEGIDLRGDGNVVCHNSVTNFSDCISVDPFTGPSYGNDVFGNDVAFCVDDGIELDHNRANVRAWRNRVTNSRMGVSVQPIEGGPAYVLRNEFVNIDYEPVKMHNYTTGLVIAHNSGIKRGFGYGDSGSMWRNTILRNNLFHGDWYAFEFTTVPDEGFRDFDYNAWGTSADSGLPWFKWNNVRYDRVTDLPPGVEDNGVAVDQSDLFDAGLPATYGDGVAVGSKDLRLRPGTPAIDAGTALANLNDPFGVVGTPDMGAFESGAALPGYGPRGELPDPDPDPDPAGDEVRVVTAYFEVSGRLGSGDIDFTRDRLGLRSVTGTGSFSDRGRAVMLGFDMNRYGSGPLWYGRIDASVSGRSWVLPVWVALVRPVGASSVVSLSAFIDTSTSPPRWALAAWQVTDRG